MKQKYGVKTRVFLSFSIFIFLIINIFSCALYFFTIQTFIYDIEKNIKNQAGVIKSFIDLDENEFYALPNNQVEQINNLGFFFYIGKNSNNTEYKNGINLYNNELVFKELYKDFIIIVGKDIKDLKKLQTNFINIIILLNILSLFFASITSYLITNRVLKPLKKLSEYFSNFDIYETQQLLVNNYGESEIGKLNKAINKFIKDIKNIFDAQKNFIQDTSHELKTPLMQIETNLDLLKNLEDNDKIRINQIRTSVNNMNEIISNISFILRGDEKILKNNNIDINKYFIELIKNYKNLAKNKNIKIKIILKNNFTVNTNIYYLDRLFGNILSNAIYYNNGNNNIEIYIDKNIVKINDNGIGINKKELNKIFNRFYRAKNSTIYSKNGNGLGLSIVKKICDMFNWIIKIDSKEGKGSIVSIEF